MGEVMPISGQQLRILRLMRLLRLIRFARHIAALEGLHIMGTSIQGMYMIVFWAMVLLTLILSVIALILFQILHRVYFDDAVRQHAQGSDATLRREVFKYFGSFTRCLFSMFELTLANWPPIARLLVEEVSEWFMLFCLIHKLAIGFAIVGVINGVILQETFRVASNDDAIMVRQHQRQAARIENKMMKLLNALDVDRDGTVGIEEFMSIAQHKEIKAWLAAMDIITDDVPTLFALIDVNQDGRISAEELVSRIPRIKGFARCTDVLAMAKRLPLMLKKYNSSNSMSGT